MLVVVMRVLTALASPRSTGLSFALLRKIATCPDSTFLSGGGKQLVEHFEKARLKIKVKTKIYRQDRKKLDGNSVIRFHVLGTGSNGTSKSVLLNTSTSSYLFNCGEGVPRQMFEHGTGIWTKVENMFLTYKSWDQLGGTLDFCAVLESAQGVQLTGLFLHGIGYLDSVVGSTKRTAFGSEIGKSVKMYPIDKKFSDHMISVGKIRISNASDPDNDDKAACAFKILVHKQKRVVDNSKLIKLCLKWGPWIQELINTDEPVKVGSRIVSPDDVLFPAKRQECGLVIDCPSLEHINSLCQQSEQLKEAPNKSFLDFVIHLSPDEVYNHESYQNWMTEFDPQTQHLVISEKTEDVCLTTAWRKQVALNLIDQNMFPLLRPLPVESVLHDTISDCDDKTNVHILPSGAVYTLRPRQNLSLTGVPKKTKDSVYDSFPMKEQIFKKLADRESLMNADDTRQYPVISFLGTGASLPSAFRGTSGILVQNSESNSMLLDCGSGTYGQLVRLYGPSKSADILRSLSTIFVSHGHSDHHIGLTAMLLARKAAFQDDPLPPLSLIAPGKLGYWFKHLNHQFSDCMEGVRFTQAQHLVASSSSKHTPEKFSKRILLLQNELTTLNTVIVKHAYSQSCFGIVLGGEDWKLAYSGDTMPCRALIDAAQGVDLLIHEATSDDNKVKDAQMKTHSTTSQAMAVGRACKAKFTLLTHFSAMHTVIPIVTEGLLEADDVGVAFDSLVVRLRDLPNTTMKSLFPVLSAMYLDKLNIKTHMRSSLTTFRNTDMSADDKVQALNQYTEMLDQSMEGLLTNR